ncbi:Uncharacterised protein [Mycobacteroides abscessus subsp. abscessus]|nr:Uncharacterised protein [Mycobacteroides abscessus subsp. abscessus]SKP51113.1 Uncharacterised protein [Mycobacteroides abscessus subsp. massiliense]SKY27371.1 Uncharacterised protein [Mycobacteroides abscessus subsp. abscessus]
MSTISAAKVVTNMGFGQRATRMPTRRHSRVDRTVDLGSNQPNLRAPINRAPGVTVTAESTVKIMVMAPGIPIDLIMSSWANVMQDRAPATVKPDAITTGATPR